MSTNESRVPGRHILLPQHMNVSELALWLNSSAVEQFTDEQKRIFEPEELKDFEHESSVNGREMNRLNDLITKIKRHVLKGSKEPLEITVPATQGTKLLEAYRRQNDDLLECGFEKVETQIFGIPSAETETMEFFDIEGNHIEDRSRPLSPKEKHTHLGMFQKGKQGSKMFVPAGYKGINEETGEAYTEEDLRNGTEG